MSSFLRRRFGGSNNANDTPDSPSISSTDISPLPSPSPSEFLELPVEGKPSSGKRPNNLRVITAEQLHTLKRKGQHRKRKNAWVFGLGGVFGLILAGLFAGHNDLISMQGLENVNLEGLREVLPAGFMSGLGELQVSFGRKDISSELWVS